MSSRGRCNEGRRFRGYNEPWGQRYCKVIPETRVCFGFRSHRKEGPPIVLERLEPLAQRET